MTSALQNRLVGTIIVVALVVIFVPELLDGEKRTNKQTFVDVPPVSQLVEVQSVDPIDSSQITAELQREEVIDDTIAIDADEGTSDASQVTSEAETTNLDAANTTEEQAIDNQNVALASQNNSENSDTQNNEVQDTTLEQVSSNQPAVTDLNDINIEDSGWVIHLGSFQHEKNVKSLLKTLFDAGYRTYTRPVTNSAGIKLTKVIVGPELDREKLELALPHLFEITQLKGRITPFEVSTN